MIFVVDCSVAASWLLPDEVSSVADALLIEAGGDVLLAPFILPAEIRNVILTAERRGRINRVQREICLARLSELPIAVLPDVSDDLHALSYGLALRFQLSYYDALYLRLAASLVLPLATFDKRLARAAIELDVPVLGGVTGAA